MRGQILWVGRRMLQLPEHARLPGTAIRHCSNGELVSHELKLDGKVAVITLNNPSKLNALTVPLGQALFDTVSRVGEMEGLRAVILTGAGRAFSAGGDLDWLLQRHKDTPDNNKSIMQNFYKRCLNLRSLPVPVIAAINGPAIGAGICLALGGADIRVASNKASMGFTFVKLGLHPGMAATHFLPLIVGQQAAAELLLTGRVLTAPEALKCGLVSYTCDNALEKSLSLAEEICEAAPAAVNSCVQTLRLKQNQGLEETFKRESECQALSYATQDLAEGVRALQEKRPTVFKGN